MKYLLLFLFFLSFATLCRAQETQLKAPFILDPSIGDTLRPAERQYFNLFTRIQNFLWAVFFLNTDSTLRTKICFVRNGAVADTIIEKFSSLKSMQFHLEEIRRHKTPGSKPDEEDQEFVLNNGINLRGTLLSDGKDSITMYSKTLGTLRFSKSQMAAQDTEVPPPVILDPGMSRLFLMPAGTVVPQGHGYVYLGELHYASVSLGITDRLTLNGGLLPFPVSGGKQMVNLWMKLWPVSGGEQVFSYGAKLRLLEDRGGGSVSAGVEFLHSPAGNSVASYGYLALNNGSASGNFSLIIGYEHDIPSYFNSNLGLMAGGGWNLEISEHIRFLLEGYFNYYWDVFPVAAGLRFLSRDISVDLGCAFLLGIPAGDGGTIPFPIISLAYRF